MISMGDAAAETVSVLYTGLRAPAEVPPGLSVVHRPMLDVEWTDASPSDLEGLLTPEAILVVYSRTAVERLDVQDWLARLPELTELPWWAVGQKTADALETRLGLRAQVPDDQHFDGLVETLSRHLRDAGPRRLISLSLEGTRRDLDAALPEGASDWVDCPLYRTVKAEYPNLAEELRVQPPDWIAFTSSKGVDAFASNVDLESADARIAAIGPSTAEHLRTLGLSVDFVPDEPGRAALLSGLS
jgi:uroporphyrinogen-III synthase